MTVTTTFSVQSSLTVKAVCLNCGGYYHCHVCERDNGQIPGCFFYLYGHGYLQTYHNQTVSHSVSSGLGAL